MAQAAAWEKEYRDPQLLSEGDEPQNDVKRFLRFLHKERDVTLSGLSILDLGSGTGRNANHLAAMGNTVVGLEIARNAVTLSQQRARALRVAVDYRAHNIGEHFPFPDDSFDVVLDVTSSTSLTEGERAVYLSETARVLKSGGYFFVRALCKEGDKNAKNLIKMNPGPETDTYINQDMGLTERVFTEADFRSHYAPYFTIISLEKKTGYARFKGQNYKRNYWLAYVQKV